METRATDQYLYQIINIILILLSKHRIYKWHKQNQLIINLILIKLRCAFKTLESYLVWQIKNSTM